MRTPNALFVAATAWLSVAAMLRSDALAKPEDAPEPRAVRAFVGQLKLTNADGNQKYCSGAFVHPRVILTAAHCVREYGPLGRMHDVEEFRQDAVATPFQLSACIVYPGEWETVTHQYLRIPYDYAFIRIRDDQPDAARYLDGVGEIKNANKLVTVFGYPAEDSLEWKTSLQPGEDVIHPVPAQVEFADPDKEFGRGTSGGPWIAKSGNLFNAVGVNSSFIARPIKPGVVDLYGPSLDAAQQYLGRAIANCP